MRAAIAFLHNRERPPRRTVVEGEEALVPGLRAIIRPFLVVEHRHHSPPWRSQRERNLARTGSCAPTALIELGYGECFGSSLGFGVFKIARRAGFLPEPMFEIFDSLMYEETRSIVFFINQLAWREVRRRRGAVWWLALTSLRFNGRAARRLLGTARQGRRLSSTISPICPMPESTTEISAERVALDPTAFRYAFPCDLARIRAAALSERRLTFAGERHAEGGHIRRCANE